MSDRKQTVTIDTEYLLNRLETLERIINDIRAVARAGVGRPASPTGINIHALEWKTKGSQPARDDDAWAWAFAYDQDGVLMDAARQLVDELERYGKVEVDGYEITLSGRDKNLLSRKKLKGRR